MDETNKKSFEQLCEGATKARRQGAWGVAAKYFNLAEGAARQLARESVSLVLQEKYAKLAETMRAAAADCDAARAEDRKPPAAEGGSAETAAVARISRATCERFQKLAEEAEGRREWDAAASYYVEAAKAFHDLSLQPEQAGMQELLAQRVLMLRQKALKCQAQKGSGGTTTRPASSRQSGGGGGGPGGGGGQGGEDDGPSADQWVVKEKPNLKFADVAGLDEVKEDIRLKMIYPFEHPELAKKFGVRLGGGVLFYGPPGTGKTMLAKATAGEVDATFFRVSSADMLSKWVGEAEQNIKKLFDAAAGEKRAIIFIDEIEALVPARRDDGSSVMQRVVPQILQGMEGFDKKGDRAVLFMGATNVPWQLDPAVLRPGRFDDKVYIPLPDLPARRKLLELYLAKRPVAPDVDFDRLADALAGFSGADIKYVCDRSAQIPFMRAIARSASGEAAAEEQITQPVLDDVIATAPRSVTPEAIRKFEQWGRTAANT